MEKPEPATVAAFEAAFPDDPRAARRTMFGMASGTVNGNLFAGVFEQGITLRLGEARASELARRHEGIGPFMPGGRRWPDYALALAARWSGSAELRGWVREALDYTAALPAKADKVKGARAAPKAAAKAKAASKAAPKAAPKAKAAKKAAAKTKAKPAAKPTAKPAAKPKAKGARSEPSET